VTPIFMVALLIYLVVASYVAHEYGHAFTAKALGGKLHGWRFYWYAVGYAIEVPSGNRLRLTALGGIVVTLALAGVGWMLTPAWWAVCLMVFNLALAFCNLIPVPGTDGWIILKGKATSRNLEP